MMKYSSHRLFTENPNIENHLWLLVPTREEMSHETPRSKVHRAHHLSIYPFIHEQRLGQACSTPSCPLEKLISHWVCLEVEQLSSFRQDLCYLLCLV